jgi:hypothetical protein
MFRSARSQLGLNRLRTPILRHGEHRDLFGGGLMVDQLAHRGMDRGRATARHEGAKRASFGVPDFAIERVDPKRLIDLCAAGEGRT